ncbi:MAG: hypothetical protein LBI28_00940 [Treponema sp.]|jgi:hypothetical protein|nr:hypothetical protein [Treponema sp.]
MLLLYVVIILIKSNFNLPEKFAGKLPYNMEIKDSKYDIKKMCSMAKKKILLVGPNQSYIFGYEKQEQSDKMFKNIIGEKIINDSVDIFIVIMDYKQEWIKTLNALSSGNSEAQYKIEENRIDSYLNNFDERLKIMYKNQPKNVKKIEEHLSIYKVNYSLNSICLIDDKRGYFQLVDNNTGGSKRLIFYINNSDKRIIDNIYSKLSCSEYESIWRKETNNSILNVN